MKINEVHDTEEPTLNFDIVDDAIVFMRNDPAFYRKRYFPAVMILADALKNGNEVNTKSVLGSVVDSGINSYCKKFNLSKKPADLFTMEDREAILSKIASEEMDLIRKGEYE